MFEAKVAQFYRQRGYEVHENPKVRGGSGNVYTVPIVANGPLGALLVSFGDAGGVDGAEVGRVRTMARDIGATPVIAVPALSPDLRRLAAQMAVVVVDEATVTDSAPAPSAAGAEALRRDLEAHPWPASGRAPGVPRGGPAQARDVDDLLLDLQQAGTFGPPGRVPPQAAAAGWELLGGHAGQSAVLLPNPAPAPGPATAPAAQANAAAPAAAMTASHAASSTAPPSSSPIMPATMAAPGPASAPVGNVAVQAARAPRFSWLQNQSSAQGPGVVSTAGSLTGASELAIGANLPAQSPPGRVDLSALLGRAATQAAPAAPAVPPAVERDVAVLARYPPLRRIQYAVEDAVAATRYWPWGWIAGAAVGATALIVAIRLLA